MSRAIHLRNRASLLTPERCCQVGESAVDLLCPCFMPSSLLYPTPKFSIPESDVPSCTWNTHKPFSHPHVNPPRAPCCSGTSETTPTFIFSLYLFFGGRCTHTCVFHEPWLCNWLHKCYSVSRAVSPQEQKGALVGSGLLDLAALTCVWWSGMDGGLQVGTLRWLGRKRGCNVASYSSP